VEKPQDELELGQTVQVQIVGVDFEKRRVSLSMRALLEDEPTPVYDEPEDDDMEDAVVASSDSEGGNTIADLFANAVEAEEAVE